MSECTFFDVASKICFANSGGPNNMLIMSRLIRIYTVCHSVLIYIEAIVWDNDSDQI